MFKDEILINLLNNNYNIAQFVSANNQGQLRFIKLIEEIKTNNLLDGIRKLFQLSKNNTVNVRSYLPEQAQGCPFVYGLKNIIDVEAVLNKRQNEGLYTIINETIDIKDGGVSGVSDNNIMEIIPEDIPRGVEKYKCSTLPKWLGISLLNIIYNSTLIFDNDRIEFSVHPNSCGVLQDNYIVWEKQKTSNNIKPNLFWPNPLSKFLGDKVYGLLIAHSYGFKVPFTKVYHRKIKNFSFGELTKNLEVWTRTCPAIQTPGLFTTIKGYTNPMELLNNDDPENKYIPSCIVQNGIKHEFSGALITDINEKPIVNGVKGAGDSFMQGENINDLPKEIINKVINLWKSINEKIGPISFEWVFDGNYVWIVQLHIGKSMSEENIIYPGNPKTWLNFDPSNGLNTLRKLICEKNIGINIIKPVGMTSHVADILRQAKIPSKIL